MSKLQSERAGDVFRRPGEREREGVLEHCKGANGLDKVVLRKVRGSSAEVPTTTNPSLSPILFHVLQHFCSFIQF
ncbi:hypothetical protein C1H46_024649 [Malus baccata]|uniref:Uncharacterized protein n=1 Tax=Malus baccata TaxID=106549 RepID=A0A540LTG6_MALBA|nr:hypothetical protein C1H46_024649 [Malus baccata]